MGFLGNSASHIADANLIVQMATLLLLLAGVYFVRTGRLKHHGRVMKSAIVIQFGALGIWMAPSLILNIGALSPLGTGPLFTLLHILGGVLALTLAISAALHRSVVFTELRRTMWTTFIVWSLAAIFGIAFYIHYYLS